MEEKIKYNISYLEYKFSKYNTVLNIFIFISFIFLDIIYKEHILLFPDIIRLIPSLTVYLILFRRGSEINFFKVGKKAIFGYIFLLFFANIFIAKFSFSVIYEVFIFISSFLLYYYYNKAILYAAIVIMVWPVSILFYYIVGDKIVFNEEYIVARSLLNFVVVFLMTTKIIYFLIQISIQKAILHYIQTNEIHVEKFLWFKFDLVTQFSPKETISSTLIPGHEKLFKLIEDFMKKDKPWLDPEYSVEQLSRDLKTNILYISQAINTCAKTNFKSYLNEFRLFAFINELKKVKQDKVSLKEIYLNVGFHNQATFNRVFKNRFNMTPQEYMENIADSVDE